MPVEGKESFPTIPSTQNNESAPNNHTSVEGGSRISVSSPVISTVLGVLTQSAKIRIPPQHFFCGEPYVPARIQLDSPRIVSLPILKRLMTQPRNRDISAEVQVLAEEYAVQRIAADYSEVEVIIPLPPGWNENEVSVEIRLRVDYPLSQPELLVPSDLRYHGMRVREMSRAVESGKCRYRVTGWNESLTLRSWLDKEVFAELERPTPIPTI